VSDDGGLKLFFQERQEPEANASTGAFGVAIGGVFAPGLAAGTEISAKIGAADFEERAKDSAGFGVNAAKAGEAGAAEDVSEDGFGLVVGGVGHGNFVEKAFGDETVEEGIAGTARGVFKIGALAFGFSGDVFAGHEELQAVFGGEPGDEFLVGFGGAAPQFVIEMNDGKNDGKFFAQFDEEMEEGDRIGAAGNGNADARARTQDLRLHHVNPEGLRECGFFGHL